MTEQLLSLYFPSIASLTLIPSRGGVFVVMLDGEVIFSKKELGRHAEPGEIARIFEQRLNVTPIAQDEG